MTSSNTIFTHSYRFARRLGAQSRAGARKAAARLTARGRQAHSVSDEQAAAPASVTYSGPPELAVIVPAYNVEDFLTDCVRSIVSQSFTHWEMIIVDDGSPGRTGQIADELAAEDSRITVVHQSNQGLGAARNTGIAASTAPYLTFIDSDDLLPAGAFERMMTSLKSSGSDIAIGSIDRFNSLRHWTPFWVELVHREYRQGITAKDLPPVMWDVFACNKIFKRTTWNEFVGEFPVGTLYEDQECTAKLFVNDARLDILPEIVYHWRHREDGLSITQQKSNINDLRQRLDVAREVRGIIESYDAAYTEYWYSKCLGEDLFYYYREVPRTGEEFFSVLQEGTREFFETASDASIAGIAPDRRWLAYLVAFGTRDDVVEVLNAFDVYRTYYRVEESEGQLVGGVPGLESVLDRIPQRLRVVAPNQLTPEVLLSHVGTDDTGALVVEGFGYIPNLDHRLTYSASLVSDHRVIASSSSEVLSEAPGHLTADPYSAHDDTKFRIVFSAEALDGGLSDLDKTESGDWDLVIHLDGEIHRWDGVRPKRSPDGPACWPAPGEITERGVRFAVIGSPGSGTQVRFLKPRFEVRNLQVADGMLIVEIRQNRDNGLRNHDRFDLDDAVVRVRDGGSVLSSVPVTSDGSTHRAALPLSELESGPLNQIRTVVAIDVVCGGTIAAALAASTAAIARLPQACVVSPALSGFGYLQIERFAVNPVVDSVNVDPSSGTLIVGGGFGVDPALVRSFSPSLVLVGKGSTVPLSRLQWDRESRRFVAEFDLARAGRNTTPIANDVFIMQSLLPTKQAMPASVWVRVDKSVEAGFPQDLSTDKHTLRLTAVGKSRALRLQVTGPGDTKLNSSAYRTRTLTTELFADPTRAIDAGTVLFESFGGNTISDSPKEIDRVLARRRPEVRRFWSVRDLSMQVPDGAIPLVVGTEAWMRQLASSKLVVNNNNFPHYFRKAVGQRYLQTWHGTPLKRIGNDVPSANLSLRYRALMKKEAETEWDLLLAQSDWAAERLSHAFSSGAPVFSSGYPRNDALVDPGRVRAGAERVRRRYGINSEKTIVLYAPTWRDHLKDRSGRYSRVDFLGLDQASTRLGDRYVIVYRGHANSVFSEAKPLPDRVVDVSLYEDVNDLISAADMMLTDYSSIMFDFVVTGKPIAFIAPDLKEYRDDVRGFYFDFENTAPGPILSTGAEAVDWIASTKGTDHLSTERYLDFVATFAPMDDGRSAERLHLLVGQLLDSPAKEYGET